MQSITYTVQVNSNTVKTIYTKTGWVHHIFSMLTGVRVYQLVVLGREHWIED